MQSDARATPTLRAVSGREGFVLPALMILALVGMLFGLVNHWSPSNGGNLNGTNLVKPQYTGKGYKNPLLATAGASSNELPQDLDHWSDVYAADEWYTQYLFDPADVRTDLNALGGFAELLDSVSCDLQDVA